MSRGEVRTDQSFNSGEGAPAVPPIELGHLAFSGTEATAQPEEHTKPKLTPGSTLDRLGIPREFAQQVQGLLDENGGTVHYAEIVRGIEGTDRVTSEVAHLYRKRLKKMAQAGFFVRRHVRGFFSDKRHADDPIPEYDPGIHSIKIQKSYNEMRPHGHKEAETARKKEIQAAIDKLHSGQIKPSRKKRGRRDVY